MEGEGYSPSPPLNLPLYTMANISFLPYLIVGNYSFYLYVIRNSQLFTGKFIAIAIASY